MKKIQILIVGGVLLLAVAIIALIATQGSNQTQESRNTLDKAPEQQSNTINPQPKDLEEDKETEETTTNSAAGTYLRYQSSLLDPNKKNILFFQADWCPSCRALDSDINQNLSQIPADTQILIVKYDSQSGATNEELELKDKYQIMYQHTFVQVDENGNELAKWAGSFTLANLLSEVI